MAAATLDSAPIVEEHSAEGDEQPHALWHERVWRALVAYGHRASEELDPLLVERVNRAIRRAALGGHAIATDQLEVLARRAILRIEGNRKSHRETVAAVVLDLFTDGRIRAVTREGHHRCWLFGFDQPLPAGFIDSDLFGLERR